MSEEHVRGLAELQRFLDQVPAKVEKNIMRGALRAGMKVVLPRVQSNVHSVSGLLAAGLKIGTRAKGGTVIANIKAKGPHGFLAKFLEFGVAAHFIAAKDGMLNFGGTFISKVLHPGLRPHPFMRPALDSESRPAVIAAANYMRSRLEKKNGLDLSDVFIEGDE